MVVLHEVDFPPEDFSKAAVVEAFKKEASLVAEHFGFENEDIRYRG